MSGRGTSLSHVTSERARTLDSSMPERPNTEEGDNSFVADRRSRL